MSAGATDRATAFNAETCQGVSLRDVLLRGWHPTAKRGDYFRGGEMMEERIISLEAAKLLREFDIQLPMSHYYVLNFMNFKEDGVLIKSDSISKRNLKGQPHLARACTQNALLKRLREDYKKLIVVDVTIECRYYFSIYDLAAKRCAEIVTPRRHDSFETYEDAAEQGLIDCLNLIKP